MRSAVTTYKKRRRKQKLLHIHVTACTHLYKFIEIVQHFFDKKFALTQKNWTFPAPRLSILTFTTA